tara:strand:+ start:2353 stop:2949 length:597 start_codon:yes stop_codon:yes gene_type:complete
MFDNIYFYNLNETIDIDLLEDNVDILIDYIPDTKIYEKLDINNDLLNFKNKLIGIDICFYFGYNSLIQDFISKNNVNYLIENTMKKNSLIDKYYMKYLSEYEKKHFEILLNLYESIKKIHNKIESDYKIAQKKKYELDIINKALVEYFEDNIKQIVNDYFLKIKLFYILSIILSPKNQKYILIFDKNLQEQIKSLLGY